MRIARHSCSGVLVAAALLASGAAFAQVDCSKLVEDLRGRCEAINRMNDACAGSSGKARKRCERERLKFSEFEDCASAPAAARTTCEAHNRAVERAERCNGKTGRALEACTRLYPVRAGSRAL